MLELLRKNILTLLSSIEDCYERKQILPCLILIYSGIDFVASIERKQGDTTSAAFERWANAYILPEINFKCSAMDLYGARCGIVHTLSPSSTSSKIGKAKEIIYAWGKSNTEDMKIINKKFGRNYIVLHVEDLINYFKLGVSRFLYEISNDSARGSLLNTKAGAWFTNMDKALISNVLEIIKKSPDT